MAHLKQAVAIFAEVGSADDPIQPEIWKLTEWRLAFGAITDCFVNPPSVGLGVPRLGR